MSAWSIGIRFGRPWYEHHRNAAQQGLAPDGARRSGPFLSPGPVVEARPAGEARRSTPFLGKCRAALAVSLVAVLALAPLEALACSCPASSVEQWYSQARVVFSGELVAAQPHPTDRCGDETLTFSVRELFKGPRTKTVVMKNGSVGRHKDGSLPKDNERVCIAQCADFVALGRRYIVFAGGDELQLWGCALVPLESSDAKQSLKRLRGLSKHERR